MCPKITPVKFRKFVCPECTTEFNARAFRHLPTCPSCRKAVPFPEEIKKEYKNVPTQKQAKKSKINVSKIEVKEESNVEPDNTNTCIDEQSRTESEHGTEPDKPQKSDTRKIKYYPREPECSTEFEYWGV